MFQQNRITSENHLLFQWDLENFDPLLVGDAMHQSKNILTVVCEIPLIQLHEDKMAYFNPFRRHGPLKKWCYR